MSERGGRGRLSLVITWAVALLGSGWIAINAFAAGKKTLKEEGSQLSPTPSVKIRDTNPESSRHYQYTRSSDFVKRTVCPRRELNPDLHLGGMTLFPLSYGGIAAILAQGAGRTGGIGGPA